MARKTSRASDDVDKLFSTAGLLLVDSMVFQEVAARVDSNIPTLSSIQASSNIKHALEKTWEKIIRDVNYEPIFEISLRVLRNLPASPLLNEQLKQLLNLAYDIAASKVLLRHDLFGRIYHQLLLGKLVKYYATYYTSIPAARLLARLLVNLPSPLQADSVPLKYGADILRVVDFACGSGTLLSAVYKELDVKHRLESDEPAVSDLHRYLVEDGLWGFDVLHHAVHLAATVIFMHNPTTVSRSRLYALRMELAGKNHYLGSLNFLENGVLTPSMLLSGEISQDVRSISVRAETSPSLNLPSFHLCIMNPPFTRSVGGNLLFGALPKEQRTALQRKLAQLLKSLGLSGIGQAGLGAAFIFLADRYLTEGGRVGVVLPRAVVSGVSWQPVRERLLKDYHVEYIITSYEGGDNWNFSENTSLSEVLLVARKLRQGERPGYTYFVNLWRRPANELESIHIGTHLTELYRSNAASLHDIENSNASPHHLKLHGRKVGEAYSARLKDTDMGLFNFFAQMELNRVAVLARHGIVYLPSKGIVGRIPLTPLSQLGEVGPDRRQIHNAFQTAELRRGCLYKALWGHDSDRVRTIGQKPNACLEPRDEENARLLWSMSGKLLIVERARLTTYRVASIYLEEPVLSNVWWPVRVGDSLSKILSVWLNSTYGFILLASKAEVTEGPWIGFKKAAVADMPVLDPAKLSDEQKNKLLRCYRELCGREFKPFPEEFENPQTRRELDEHLGEALGLETKLDELYKLLAADPMITGKPITRTP